MLFFLTLTACVASLDKLDLTHSPYRESMTGTISFKFSIGGKVEENNVVIGIFKRTHEISRFVAQLCRNLSRDTQKQLPSYKDSPVYFIKQNEYFETGKLVTGSAQTADGTETAADKSEPYIYRSEGSTINARKIRTRHEGYVASMVLDSGEFTEGLRREEFPLNSRLSFSTVASRELDEKNIVFGFLISGQNVINKILSQKLLGASKTDIKIHSCYDPEFNGFQDDI